MVDGDVNRFIVRVRVIALSVCVGREKVVHMHVPEWIITVGHRPKSKPNSPRAERVS